MTYLSLATHHRLLGVSDTHLHTCYVLTVCATCSFVIWLLSGLASADVLFRVFGLYACCTCSCMLRAVTEWLRAV